MKEDDLTRVLKDLVARFTTARIRFYLTGGLVSSFYGEPRFTQDIDLVLPLADTTDTERLMACISSDYFVDQELLENAVRESSMAQLLHKETFIRIDLHVSELIPGTFTRVHPVEIFPGVVIPILSKEDAILTKLKWIQLGSHKSRRDVVMMLRRDTPTNLAFIEQQATELGLSTLLHELQNQATGSTES